MRRFSFLLIPSILVAAGAAMTLIAAVLSLYCAFDRSEKWGVVYVVGHLWYLPHWATAAAVPGGICLGAGLARLRRRLPREFAPRGFEVIGVPHGSDGRAQS